MEFTEAQKARQRAAIDAALKEALALLVPTDKRGAESEAEEPEADEKPAE